MRLDSAQSSLHMVKLSLSPTQVLPGHVATLRWQVVGIGVSVRGVQLASSNEHGPRMIEGVPAEGSRQMIFTEPGRFTFTLTATFSDGERRGKRVTLTVSNLMAFDDQNGYRGG